MMIRHIMKEIGSMIWKMDRVIKLMEMAIIKAVLKIIWGMGLEHINIKMAILIKVYSRKIFTKVREFLSRAMPIFMKEIFKKDWCKEKANLLIQMETFIKGNFITIKLMDSA